MRREAMALSEYVGAAGDPHAMLVAMLLTEMFANLAC